jgi:hypothetical protein
VWKCSRFARSREDSILYKALLKNIETGKLNVDDIIVRMRDLQQRQEKLHTRRIEIESQISDRKVGLADLKTISLYVDDLHDLLNRGSIAERRSFIKSFVKEIRVTGKDVVIDYSIPPTPDKLAFGIEGVPPTVQYSGR